MNLQLQDQNELIAIVPGVYQEDSNKLFHAVALGLTNDSIVVYNDNIPDATQEGNYVYNVKKRVLLKDTLMVLKEKVNYVKYFNYCYRINVITQDANQCIAVYFRKEDMKYAKAFMKAAKNSVKTKSRTVTVE